MTGDLELEVRSCKTFEELKDVIIKISELLDEDNILNRCDKIETRLQDVEDSQ